MAGLGSICNILFMALAIRIDIHSSFGSDIKRLQNISLKISTILIKHSKNEKHLHNWINN